MRLTATCFLLVLASALPAQSVSSLDVVVIADRDSPRAKAITAKLRAVGMQTRGVRPEACSPSAFWNADVVVVDWPGDMIVDAAKVGAFWRWHRPTLFLGGSGRNFAAAWQLPNAEQMAGMAAAERGPAMQMLLVGEGEAMTVWRHGNLFHLPADRTRQWTPDSLTILAACVQRAATFVTDRPVIRYSTADDVARRDLVVELAKKLKVAIHDMAALQALPARIRTADERDARRLLASCLEGGPTESETLNNWKNWLRARADAMCWDPLSKIWRVDTLAQWRKVKSADLRGEDRRDGKIRDEQAVEIAKKTVQFYGGRALNDLMTVSFWYGDMLYMWDRRRGFFRVESHVQLGPRVRATPWQASAMDSFADQQLVWGNGNRRGPRIAARGMYRDMVERTFLPLMLLDPGMGLRYLEEESNAQVAVVAVKLAGRGLELNSEFVLTIERETGAVKQFEERGRSRLVTVFELVETTACGPLKLPTCWNAKTLRRAREHKIVDVQWNPKLPDGIESATGHLTKPRGK